MKPVAPEGEVDRARIIGVARYALGTKLKLDSDDRAVFESL